MLAAQGEQNPFPEAFHWELVLEKAPAALRDPCPDLPPAQQHPARSSRRCSQHSGPKPAPGLRVSIPMAVLLTGAEISQTQHTPRVPQQPCQPMRASVEETPHHSHEGGTHTYQQHALAPPRTLRPIPTWGEGHPTELLPWPWGSKVTRLPPALPTAYLPSVPAAPCLQGPGPEVTTGTHGVGHQHTRC